MGWTAVTGCSSGWTWARVITTRSGWLRMANGCTTHRCRTPRPGWGSCSTSSAATARFWLWSTSPPRSAPCRSRSPEHPGIRASGHQVAYLPGLAMRRIADLHPGTAKTDARDAYVIADAARTLPHTLRRVDTGDETLAELEVLVGYDDDLAGEATRVSNRIRGLLTQIHPALERVLGPKVQHRAVLELLSRGGGPAGLRNAGRRKLVSIVAAHAPRMGERLVEQVMTALDEQTVTVPGTAAAETILPRLADSLRDVLRQRATVAAEVERMLDAHPLAGVLT